MRRSLMVLPSLVVLGVTALEACASVRQVPKPALKSVAESPRCTADVDFKNVANWHQISYAGVNFCLPTNWKLDERTEEVQAQRAARPFRVLSWIGPDSLQRVTIEVPLTSSARNQLLQSLETCEPVRYTVDLDGQEGCATVGYGASVVMRAPLLRLWTKGVEDAAIVASTLRAVPPTASN